MRTAYSRLGRVVEVAIDMGRTSQPLSVFSERKVNCVGRKENPAGFFTMMLWVWGVSRREATTVVSTAWPPHPPRGSRLHGLSPLPTAHPVYLDEVCQ